MKTLQSLDNIEDSAKPFIERCRRFEDNQEYAIAYSCYADSNSFLNCKNSSSDYGAMMATHTKKAFQKCLLIVEGNEDGIHFKDRQKITADKPAARQKVEEAEAKFDKWAEQQVVGGKLLAKPNVMDDIVRGDIRSDYIDAVAKFDVQKAVQAWLKHEIKRIEQEKTDFEAEFMLLGGTCGYIHDQEYDHVHNNGAPKHVKHYKILDVDGQNVSYNVNEDSKIPYIDEPTSPYHKLPVNLYLKICEKWLQDNDINKSTVHRKVLKYKRTKREAVRNEIERETPELPKVPKKFVLVGTLMKHLGDPEYLQKFKTI